MRDNGLRIALNADVPYNRKCLKIHGSHGMTGGIGDERESAVPRNFFSLATGYGR